MRNNVEYSSDFRRLMRAVDVPISHLQPRNSSSVATSMSADTVDTLRGLAEAYGVPPGHVIRACIVIGLEEILGAVKELKHAP